MHATRAAVAGAFAVASVLLPAGTPTAVARTTLTCQAQVPGVTAGGVPVSFRYEHGHATTQRRGPGRLGYQPRDLAYPHKATTGPTSYPATSYWFTLSGSQLQEVTEVDRLDAQGRLV